MAPYSPPTGGRAGKLRLDFNENTVGCSPARRSSFCKTALTRRALAVYPEYGEARRPLAEFFGVRREQFLFTNGTDEAIQVLVNTYVDDGDEVLLLQPVLRHVPLLRRGGRRRRSARSTTGRRDLAFPLEEVLDAITPADARRS